MVGYQVPIYTDLNLSVLLAACCLQLGHYSGQHRAMANVTFRTLEWIPGVIIFLCYVALRLLLVYLFLYHL